MRAQPRVELERAVPGGWRASAARRASRPRSSAPPGRPLRAGRRDRADPRPEPPGARGRRGSDRPRPGTPPRSSGSMSSASAAADPNAKLPAEVQQALVQRRGLELVGEHGRHRHRQPVGDLEAAAHRSGSPRRTATPRRTGRCRTPRRRACGCGGRSRRHRCRRRAPLRVRRRRGRERLAHDRQTARKSSARSRSHSASRRTAKSRGRDRGDEAAVERLSDPQGRDGRGPSRRASTTSCRRSLRA